MADEPIIFGVKGGERIGIRTIKNGPYSDYAKLDGPEAAEAIEKGCTGHTLFGGTDENGGRWTCHSRLGIAWPCEYPNYQMPDDPDPATREPSEEGNATSDAGTANGASNKNTPIPAKQGEGLAVLAAQIDSDLVFAEREMKKAEANQDLGRTLLIGTFVGSLRRMKHIAANLTEQDEGQVSAAKPRKDRFTKWNILADEKLTHPSKVTIANEGYRLGWEESAANTAPPLDEWQPISEAPEAGNVLAWGPKFVSARVMFERVDGRWVEAWEADKYHDHPQPTHWKPLPQPPIGNLPDGGSDD